MGGDPIAPSDGIHISIVPWTAIRAYVTSTAVNAIGCERYRLVRSPIGFADRDSYWLHITMDTDRRFVMSANGMDGHDRRQGS